MLVLCLYCKRVFVLPVCRQLWKLIALMWILPMYSIFTFGITSATNHIGRDVLFNYCLSGRLWTAGLLWTIFQHLCIVSAQRISSKFRILCTETIQRYLKNCPKSLQLTVPKTVSGQSLPLSFKHACTTSRCYSINLITLLNEHCLSYVCNWFVIDLL